MLGMIIDGAVAVLGSGMLAWYVSDFRVGIAMFCALFVLYPPPSGGKV